MKKEEFPTFLNEQPTIIFGRTGRELLIVVCGLLLSYRIWGDISNLLPDFVGQFLAILLAGLLMIGFLVLALVKVGYRSLEEWIFTWFLFISVPKIYLLYKPLEDDSVYQMGMEDDAARPGSSVENNKLDDLEED